MGPGGEGASGGSTGTGACPSSESGTRTPSRRSPFGPATTTSIQRASVGMPGKLTSTVVHSIGAAPAISGAMQLTAIIYREPVGEDQLPLQRPRRQRSVAAQQRDAAVPDERPLGPHDMSVDVSHVGVQGNFAARYQRALRVRPGRTVQRTTPSPRRCCPPHAAARTAVPRHCQYAAMSALR